MTAENSRADAPTDEQIASAWFATSDARNLRPHERAVEVVRKFLAASPAPQPSPSPSPADERAAFEAFARGIRMDVSVSLEGHYTDAATAYAWAAWRTRAASANETGAEAVAIPQSVINALRFYANGRHFNIDEDHQQFDTVSGEPQNWLCSERDDDCTMIEDGSIAKAALCGGVLGFEEPEKPLEGEVFTGATQPAQADAREGLTATHFVAKYGNGTIEYSTCVDGFDLDWAETRGGVEIVGLVEVESARALLK
ncbi:hypothetical protein NX868_10455 [Burkholderia thailandensis]|uniref:hypothetical protein n=1 Tax=Burkholderia thailandensis TaxID=57975 RepID=UPI00217DD5C5|nr:hypothetical protein [Burkholderia thailandensis]MCS6455983.1 hypothetical protein [Burkholderia thailandensis]MCS6482698.1 hypothetical protein [Burkholderia thailandensis]